MVIVKHTFKTRRMKIILTLGLNERVYQKSTIIKIHFKNMNLQLIYT